LTPIVGRPNWATLSPEMKETLRALSRPKHTSLAIISGRALADVRARVGIESLIYAGNHGLEIQGPDFEFVEPTAAARQKALQQLSEHLAADLSCFHSVHVEQKGLTTSIHFRGARAEEVKKIKSIVGIKLATLPHFLITKGKMVYEIRPCVAWNKGAAVHWISARLAKRKALAIYLGDDATDEDAFAALPEGITVKIGGTEPTAAQYRLDNTEQVQKFLFWLAQMLHQPSFS
ncbi:MAG: trehalose-phosphatase, partial [bacterium]